MSLKEQILSQYGKKSYGLLAREFGISRSAVAGIVWRANRAAGAKPKTKCRWAAPHRLPPGPPVGDNRSHIGFYLSEQLNTALRNEAKSLNITLSEYIRRCLANTILS